MVSAPPASPRPVVVAHGLWMPGPETIVLRRRLARAGFETHVFRYHSVSAPLDDCVAGMAALVDSLGTRGVDLVGYSLGGIVALTMLERLRPDLEGRIVCLGSPLRGSVAAERLAQLPGGPRILGRCMLALLEHGGFDAWRGTQPLGVVAGSLPVSFGRLPGDNDGTVRVDETRLPGLTDHIVVRASHTTLMFSRRAADEAIHFLRHGRFSGREPAD